MTDNSKNKKGQLMNEGITINIDEELKKALTQGENVSEVNEPTKYILIDDALVKSVDDDRVKHFTKYLNREEVLQMNDIQNHADLIEIVFNNTRGLNAEQAKHRLMHTKAIANLFRKHAHDHMDNMMSLDAKGGNIAKLLVMALKQDTNPLPADKEIKRMFGK